MRQSSLKEIVVCGYAGAERMAQSVIPYLSPLSMRQAHTRDELFEALWQCHPPVCIVEHKILSVDPIKALTETQLDAATLAAITQLFRTYELLPELARLSPETKFVITSHIRGSGLSRAEHALYRQREEVIKVMGFVNGTSNTIYLLKLLSRVYLGRTWKGYGAA